MNLIIRLLINAAALYAAAYVIEGIDFGGEGQELAITILVVAAIFGVVNTVVRPIADALACSINVLTLGLFRFVLNALMLMLTAWIATQFDYAFFVDDFRAAFFGSLVISIVSTVLDFFLGGDDRD